MSPFLSCCASSCRQSAPRSSCQPPSSQQALFRQQVPFRRLRASFQRPWEAYLVDLRFGLVKRIGFESGMNVVDEGAQDNFVVR